MPPSIPYQYLTILLQWFHHVSNPEDEKVHDNSVKFATYSHASPPGQPNGTQPTTPTMHLEATVEYDKYANAAMCPMTGTGDSIPGGMPPSYSQSTSPGGGMPAQLEGPPINQAQGPSIRPEFNQGELGANFHSNSGRQIISGCIEPEVNNDNSFNNNYYNRQVVNNDNRKRANKGRRSKKRQEDSS